MKKDCYPFAMLVSDAKATKHPLIIGAFLSACTQGERMTNATQELNAAVSEIFGREAFVVPASSGSFGNNLAVKVLAKGRPGEVLCTRTCHMMRHERGDTAQFAGVRLNPISRIEHYSHGPEDVMDAKSIDLHFKSKADYINSTIGPSSLGIVITQVDEEGHVYEDDRFIELAEAAHSKNLFIHVDGARFANAVAAGSDPKIWGRHADTICFGAKKNGAPNVDALVFFDRDLAKQAQSFVPMPEHAHKAELIAYFKDGLWLENARQANSMASILRMALDRKNIKRSPRETANIVFEYIHDEAVLEALRRQDCAPYKWPVPWEPFLGSRYRFVTAWDTQPENIYRIARIINDPLRQSLSHIHDQEEDISGWNIAFS